MLKDLLKIKKINKNMKKLVDNQIYFFENILKEISNKKYINKKYINNKYMGVSFSYGIIALNDYNSRNNSRSNSRSNSRNSNNEYKLIKNDILEIKIEKNKIKKNKRDNNIKDG